MKVSRNELNVRGPAAPVLFVLPTLMGDGRTTCIRRAAAAFRRAGWRVVVFVKRGGGMDPPLPLRTATPTCPTRSARGNA